MKQIEWKCFHLNPSSWRKVLLETTKQQQETLWCRQQLVKDLWRPSCHCKKEVSSPHDWKRLRKWFFMVIYIEETHISIRFLFGSIWASLTKVVFDTAAALFRCSSQPRDIISFLQHHDSYFTRRHNLIEKQIHSREYCSSTYSPKLNSCSNSVSFWCRQIFSHMETNGNQSLILSQVFFWNLLFHSFFLLKYWFQYGGRDPCVQES